MRSTIVILVMVCAASRVLSCEPCSCYQSPYGAWAGLQIARCYNIMDLTAVPDTFPDHTQVLHFDGGSITTINENQFVSYQNLKYIYIKRNQVNKVENHAFRNMTNVTEILLDFNVITELPVGVFSDTPHLVYLSVYENKLKVLPRLLFSNLKYLKTVDLSNNQITSIEPDCFKDVPALMKLYLSQNVLTGLSANIIDDSSSLKVLSLEDNPWHCDGTLCDLIAAVVSRGLWSCDNMGCIPTCATPPGLQGKLWSELKEHAYLQQCPSPTNITHLQVAENATVLSQSIDSASSSTDNN